MAKSTKKQRACVASEMHKLNTSAKKKKYKNPKQRVAISLHTCEIPKPKKKK